MVRNSLLNINLLPSGEQKALAREELRRIIQFFGLSISGIFFVGILLLFPSYFPLFFEERGLEQSVKIERDASEQLHVDETLKKVRFVKDALDSFSSSLARQKKTSEALVPFFSSRGSGISFTILTIKKEGNVVLSGRAEKRSDLLAFEKMLRESERFQEITFPLSNIVREIDIQFTMQGKLKPAYGL